MPCGGGGDSGRGGGDLRVGVGAVGGGSTSSVVIAGWRWQRSLVCATCSGYVVVVEMSLASAAIKNVRSGCVFEQYFGKTVSSSDFLGAYFYRAALKSSKTCTIPETRASAEGEEMGEPHRKD